MRILFSKKVTYTYSGDGLKRREVSQTGVVTTFVWDGSEYLGEV
jgi:YD repeat-containing protein